MKITLVMVSSVDGKTTKWNEAGSNFASPEDQKHFYSLLDHHNLIIMGRKTYEAAKSHMKHTHGKLRVVLTKHPERFAAEEMPGKLEFSSESPKKLLKRLSFLNFHQALLVGGAAINTLFLKERLINELYLTIEPKLFGQGNPLIGEAALDISLQLKSIEKLNEKGTLLIKYSIS